MSETIKKALLVVDVQNDFCPGGSLAVPNGDKVIDPLNRVIASFADNKYLLFFSRDWHPRETKHFEKWPVHCVGATPGASFHSGLLIPKQAIIISKGYGNTDDGYSPFEGSLFRPDDWPLSLNLLLKGAEEIYIGGLATDYCVKAACLDAVNLGYKTYLMTDACRAVNVNPGDEVRALSEMANAGVIFTTTDEVLRQNQPS